MDDIITVGSLLDPQSEDAQFPTLEAAVADARAWAKRDSHFAVAVWQGSDLYRVFLRGFELSEYEGRN